MDGRVLSIQSHVAFGYVGGKAAVFSLEAIGYEVDVVNTVNFSNHSGYGRFAGTRATAEELSDMFHAMDENGLLSPSRLLTGYIPGAEPLKVVAQVAKRLRAASRSFVYVLDPVLGDSGQMYVSSDVVPIYREMLPLATIITPNWFEVEVLTGIKIDGLNSLRNAINVLHQEYKVPHVVISSIPLKPFLHNALPASQRPNAQNTEHLLCICSSRNNPGQGKPPSTVHAHAVSCIQGYFSGVGDLFSALVLAYFYEYEYDPHDPSGLTPLSAAASQALTKTRAIVQLTHDHARYLPEDERTETDEEKDRADPMRKIKRMRGRELRVIQGMEIIRSAHAPDSRVMVPWPEFWTISA